MTKILYTFFTFLITFTLVACDNNAADNESNKDQSNETETTEENEQNNDDTMESTTDTEKNDNVEGNDQDDMIQLMEELDYIEFELEVEYSGDKEYEAEIELKNGSVKAELEDEINNIDIRGKEAFDEIYPLVKKMTVTQQTSKEDAIKETLEVFGLDSDYEEFELEITFNDQTKLEFQDRK